jgi:hypothetical protein
VRTTTPEAFGPFVFATYGEQCATSVRVVQLSARAFVPGEPAVEPRFADSVMPRWHRNAETDEDTAADPEGLWPQLVCGVNHQFAALLLHGRLRVSALSGDTPLIRINTRPGADHIAKAMAAITLPALSSDTATASTVGGAGVVVARIATLCAREPDDPATPRSWLFQVWEVPLCAPTESHAVRLRAQWRWPPAEEAASPIALSRVPFARGREHRVPQCALQWLGPSTLLWYAPGTASEIHVWTEPATSALSSAEWTYSGELAPEAHQSVRHSGDSGDSVDAEEIGRERIWDVCVVPSEPVTDPVGLMARSFCALPQRPA